MKNKLQEDLQAARELRQPTADGMSYTDYRIYMDKLTYAKAKLQKVIAERKELHRTYRVAFQRWRELQEQEERFKEELINLIPNKM